jgi:hypothetical protein
VRRDSLNEFAVVYVAHDHGSSRHDGIATYSYPVTNCRADAEKGTGADKRKASDGTARGDRGEVFNCHVVAQNCTNVNQDMLPNPDEAVERGMRADCGAHPDLDITRKPRMRGDDLHELLACPSVYKAPTHLGRAHSTQHGRLELLRRDTFKAQDWSQECGWVAKLLGRAFLDVEGWLQSEITAVSSGLKGLPPRAEYPDY